MRQEGGITGFLALSVVAALLITAISLLEPSTDIAGTSDRMIIGLAFSSCCIFGITLALRPGWTGRVLRSRKANAGKTTPSVRKRKRIGHHPDCEHYGAHRIVVGRKVFCAGCIGIAAGSAIAMSLMTVFLAIPSRSVSVHYIFIFLGLILVGANFIETIRKERSAAAHLLSSSLLPVSFFFVTLGVYGVTGSLIFGLFGILASLMWLETRVKLSKLCHASICSKCTSVCSERED